MTARVLVVVDTRSAATSDLTMTLADWQAAYAPNLDEAAARQWREEVAMVRALADRVRQARSEARDDSRECAARQAQEGRRVRQRDPHRGLVRHCLPRLRHVR